MSGVIRLYEVGPRDGLQNLEGDITTENKANLVELLLDAGLDRIEIGSFVNPKHVPQMGDSKDLFLLLLDKVGGRDAFSVLVPNKKGVEMAESVGAEFLNVYVSPSPTFLNENLGTFELSEVLDRYDEALEGIDRSRVRGYISLAFDSPFGDWDTKALEDCIVWCKENCSTVVLADTAGMATESRLTEVIKMAKRHTDDLALHLHEPQAKRVTFDKLLTTAYLAGIREFDTSIGGLGGCPFVPGSFGNLPTEYIVDWAEFYGIEIEQFISKSRLEAARLYAESITDTPLTERLTRFISGKLSGIRRRWIRSGA
jgi:hydroxymethylglutaryl-CoA lyase